MKLNDMVISWQGALRCAPTHLIVLSCLLMSAPAQAAGGPCPSGANYLNTVNPTGPHVTLASLGITNCYYVAANGSDSNSGTSEQMPWLHAPGMTSCTGNCASNTPSGGTAYIFRGGDRWHFGDASASPYTNAWSWKWSGSFQSVPLYLGVDPGWYSSASWTRPVFTGDNPPNACPGSGPCPVSSCAHPANSLPGGALMTIGGNMWNILDNFEFTGMCWTGQAEYINYYSPAQGLVTPYFLVIENLYVHGWTHATGAVENGAAGINGNSSYGGAVLQYNVVDGQDSDDHSFSPLGQNNTDAYIVRYNVLRRWGGDQVMSDCHYIHDNLFEYVNYETDGSGHGDLIFCEGEYAGGSGSPNLFFNNVFRHVGDTYGRSISYVLGMATPSGQSDYIFNNVYWSNQPSNSGDGISDENSKGSWILFNNTGVPIPNGNLIFYENTPITSVNNHWITSGGLNSIYSNPGVVSESSALYMTPSAAATQGYAVSNDYAPTASGNSTVTANGANQTVTYCADNVLHYPLAEAACTSGTSQGVAYNAANHTVSWPAIPVVKRPASGAWNVGAYQFGSVTPPPACLNACDINCDGADNVADVQAEINMVLQKTTCTNPSGSCNVTSVQKVINAALGGTCVAP